MKPAQVTMETGNYAAALAVKSARVDVVPGYPITPQTSIMEALSAMVEKGELNARFIPVEGEHSAMAAAVAASAAGARVFTATSANGLLYMHEVLHMASGGTFAGGDVQREPWYFCSLDFVGRSSGFHGAA